MGDYLPYVNIDDSELPIQVSAGEIHVCTILTNLQVKCWGGADNGRLGYGDINYRGNNPNEMGGYLPFVQLGNSVLVDQVAANSGHTVYSIIFFSNLQL